MRFQRPKLEYVQKNVSNRLLPSENFTEKFKNYGLRTTDRNFIVLTTKIYGNFPTKDWLKYHFLFVNSFHLIREKNDRTIELNSESDLKCSKCIVDFTVFGNYIPCKIFLSKANTMLLFETWMHSLEFRSTTKMFDALALYYLSCG